MNRRNTGTNAGANEGNLHQSDLIQREGVPNRGDRNSRVNNIEQQQQQQQQQSNRVSQSQKIGERRVSGFSNRRGSSSGRDNRQFSQSGVVGNGPNQNQNNQPKNIATRVSGQKAEMLRGHELRRISQNQGHATGPEAQAYSDMIQQQIVKKQGQGLKRGEFSDVKKDGPKDSNYESNLKVYFDTQIEDILDKIKACKVEGVVDCDVHVGKQHKLMNCSQSLKRGDLGEQIQHQGLNAGGNEGYVAEGQRDTRRTTQYTEQDQDPSRRDTRRTTQYTEQDPSRRDTRRTTQYTEYDEQGRETRVNTQYTQHSGSFGEESVPGDNGQSIRRTTQYTEYDPSRRTTTQQGQRITEYTQEDIIDLEQRARDMFPEKDMNNLQNRAKARTLGGQLFDELDRNRKTYGGRLIGTNPENYQQIQNLVAPDEGPLGIGEIEMLKRKTMTPDPTPNMTCKESENGSDKQSAKDDLLSEKNRNLGRPSEASDHFSFRPGNLKQNLNENMAEMMENFKDMTPVEKNITESHVLDEEGTQANNEMPRNSSTNAGRNIDIQFPERRRSKAQTLQNIRQGEKMSPRNKTIMGKLSGELMDTGNEGNLSEFDDPNEAQDESYIQSRHQSMTGEREDSPEMRVKASTIGAHHFNFRKKTSDSELMDPNVNPKRTGSMTAGPRKKGASILSRKGSRRGTMSKKRVTFSDMFVLPEEKEIDPREEFINKKPEGSVMLTREQTEKLIQVLEQPMEEGEEIILTLNGEQVLDVVNKNVGEEGVTMAVTGDQWLTMKKDRNRALSVYPKDFFALVEKDKTKGSRLSIYPGEFFAGLEGRRRTLAGDRERAVSVYPKDLFELLEKEISEGEIDVYPQEIFDLLKEFGEYNIDEDTRKKAETIYPKDFLEMAEKQAERKRGRAQTVFPKGLFDLAEQEKINGKRVSVYPKDMFKMLEKESRERGVSIYPEDFFKLLDEEYEKVVRLNQEQTELVVKANTGQKHTQIVISPEQRKTLLNQLKEHNEKVDQIKKDLNVQSGDSGFVINDDVLEPCELKLEADQVLDVFNQNCAMEGAQIELTPEQWDVLDKSSVSARHTVIGNSYYDAVKDELVDDIGQRMSLAKFSARDRKSMLSKLSEKRFSVMLAGDEHHPVMVADVYFDVDEDAVIDTRTESKMQIGALKEDERVRLLSRISKVNAAPPGTVLEGHAYYDALVDELVDAEGNRHSLKDKNLLDLRDLADNNKCHRISVIVQPDNDRALLLENVTYLPVEDCLVDAHDRKTRLGDMTSEQRNKLMTALGERRGTLIDVTRVRAKTQASELRERNSTFKINVLEVSDYQMDEDERRYMDELKERRKTGYKTPEDAAKQKRILEEGSESESGTGSESGDDCEGDTPRVSVSKVDDHELNPEEEREREKVRNRKKTEHQGHSPKKTYTKEIEELLAGEASPRNRGSVANQKKNYSALRPKGMTVHHKGVPLKKKKKRDKDSLKDSRVSMKSLKSQKSTGKGKRRRLTKRYTVVKKKKGDKGKTRRTVLGKLTEQDKARLIEEEYMRNLGDSCHSETTPKSRKSKKSKGPVVVQNLVCGGKSSIAQRILDERGEMIDKRHTMDGGRFQDLDTDEQRIKSQTIMGREVHGPKRSILTESEEVTSKGDKGSEGTRAQNSEGVVFVDESSRKSSMSPKKKNRKKNTGDNDEDNKYEENLKMFEKMDKHDIAVKRKGRVTFVEKRNVAKIHDKDRRRKTFANKLFMMRKRGSQEPDPIIEEPELNDYILHENPSNFIFPSSNIY